MLPLVLHKRSIIKGQDHLDTIVLYIIILFIVIVHVAFTKESGILKTVTFGVTEFWLNFF